MPQLEDLLRKLTTEQIIEMIADMAKRKAVISYVTVKHWIRRKGYDSLEVDGEVLPFREWSLADILNHAG